MSSLFTDREEGESREVREDRTLRLLRRMRDVGDACLWLCSPLSAFVAARFCGNELELTIFIRATDENQWK